MGLQVFISHGAGKDECVGEALELLVPELKKRGYEVFIDMEALRGTDRWVESLYAHLYMCDAAVVLLGPKTIESSEWVRRESDILMSRHTMKSLPHVLPVLLGGATTAEARRSGFGPLMSLQAAIEDRCVLNPSPALDSSVKEVIEWALREFSYVGDVTRSPEVAEWVERIADYLDQATKNATKAVVRAAKKIGLDGIHLAQIKARVGSDLLLAYQLLMASRRGPVLRQALGELQPALDGRSLNALVRQVVPGWVNAQAAQCFLPDGAEGGAKGRIILFPAFELWMAEHHIQRAFFVRPGSSSVGLLEDEADFPIDDQSPEDVLFDACADVLPRVFYAPPGTSLEELRDYPPSEGVTDYLVVSLADYSLDAAAGAALRLQEWFPRLNFILLAPPDHQPDPKEIEALALPDLVVVTPAPEREAQINAVRLKMTTDELLKQCG